MTSQASQIARKVVTNSSGYQEVELEFRKVRAAALEAAKIDQRSNRIHCPALDASRTDGAYGSKALPGTDREALDKWSDAFGLPRGAVAGIAFASGPWYSVPLQAGQGQFDESKVNTGLVKSMKHGVHTGILSKGTFDQDTLNQFVWKVLPQLSEKPIDKDLLYSDAANDLYVSGDKLDLIMEFNLEQSNSALKKMGAGLSKFEMEKLLLKKLGQNINLNQKNPVNAISLRDLHDFYKYGVFPAPVEDQLLKAGLIQETSVAMTGK